MPNSQPVARKAVGEPFLMFSMQLDSDKNVIPGLNYGRLALYDSLGLIQRWVFTSSYDQMQNVGDWERVGGICPPNSAMPGMLWYETPTEKIIQPGQPVDEGYLILYKGENTFITTAGNERSEVMNHPDKNYKTYPGSRGCLCGLPDEWYDFDRVFQQSCSHLATVKTSVIYTF